MLRKAMRALTVALLGCAAVAAAPLAHGSVQLLSDTTRIVPGRGFTLGLDFQLQPGWHIYWQNPGDSGEAPHVTWRLPAGITAGAIEWPQPRRLGTAGIVDYGYENSVLLPVPGPAAAPAAAAVLRAFAAARAALPQPPPAGWSAAAVEDAHSFTLTIRAGRRLDALAFFPYSDTQIDNAAPARLTPLPAGARLRLSKAMEDLQPSSRLAGVIELPGGAAYTIDAPVTPSGR